MSNLPTKACWKADDAKIILATEATEGSNKLFLATHSPITDFEIEGTRASEVEATTEQGLLDALSAPGTTHAFCVVEGEPGSGKSHMIRWLHIKWPEEEDLQLLIQRADGSLAGTLRQLREKLPLEHQHLFDSIGQTQDITLSGRARLFHNYLAQSLRKDFFEKPLPDAEWCDKYNLADLLGSPELVGDWQAPERILNILSGKKGERNQELARFNLDDIAQLSQLIRPLTSKSVKAVRFERMLQKEAQALQLISSEEKLDAARQEELNKDFETSFQLMNALNLRRNHAVQNLLGISSEGLKSLFMRLRKELKNRRLVLLLEDITAWEGVDNQLVDVLVTNVATREDKDLCPMVSVVGVTPEYFRSAGFHANYRQRITHHIRLGEEAASHQYQDVSSLRTHESQVSFAAKYLRAVRAGVETLTNWDDSADSLPNMCTSCTDLKDCRATFGEHEGIGLYPFNKHAITTLYAALEDPAHQATYQTPRGMIQGVLAPTLLHPEVLDAGEYPGPEIETSWIPEDKRRLGGFASDIIKAKVSSEREFNRLRRTVAYWGSGDATETQKSESGALTFFEIPEGVYRAFGLPWPGGSEAEGEAVNTPEEQPPAPDSSPEDSSPPREPAPPGTPQPKTKSASAKPTSISRAELRKLVNDIAAWMEGKRTQNPSKLNRLAYDILQGLPWQHLGISDWVRDRLFTQNTVILKGTGAERKQHYVIPNEEWAQRGMEAFHALKTARDELDGQEEETYQKRYAAMMRNLRKSVSDHTQNRLSPPGGGQWSITGTATQVLLARTWLRGAVSPLAEPWLQWQAVLKDEETPTSNPQDRVDSWSEAVAKTNGSHGKLRELLRKWVTISQGDGLTDPGDAPSAISALVETFRLSAFPSELPDAGTQLAELSILVRDAKEIKQRLPAIPNYEKDRLIRLTEDIDAKLRQSTVREHLRRVNNVVRNVSTLLPDAASVAVGEWVRLFQRLAEMGYTGSSDEGPGQLVEAFIDSRDDDSRPSDSSASVLAWALSAPASEIRVTSDALSLGETTIQALLTQVEQYLDGFGSGHDSLETLHAVGQSLASACTSALEGLKGRDDD